MASEIWMEMADRNMLYTHAIYTVLTLTLSPTVSPFMPLKKTWKWKHKLTRTHERVRALTTLFISSTIARGCAAIGRAKPSAVEGGGGIGRLGLLRYSYCFVRLSQNILMDVTRYGEQPNNNNVLSPRMAQDHSSTGPAVTHMSCVVLHSS